MDLLDEVKEIRIQVEVLYQWLKYYAHLLPGLSRSYLRRKVGSPTSFITLRNIFDCMTDCGIEAIVINIDECDKLTSSEGSEVLRMFGRELCDGAPVYFSVTGIYNINIQLSIEGSGMSRQDITLPPLKSCNVDEIVKTLELYSDNVHYHQLLWLTGGVPRLLEKLIICLAARVNISSESTVNDDSISRLRAYADRLNPMEFNAVVELWRPNCAVRKGLPKTFILSNIVALCVSDLRGTNIASIEIGNPEAPYTIGNALQNELVYLVAHSDKTESIQVPPILLSLYHQGDADNIKTSVLRQADSTLTHRDNDALYLQVLLFRLTAYRLFGVRRVTAGALLGVAVDIDYTLEVPSQISLGIAEQQITKVNFKAVENDAIVNKSGASFADSFLTLRQTNHALWTLKIQEKQSTEARTKELEEKPATRSLVSSVKEENDKCAGVGDETFLYITDFNEICGLGDNEQGSVVLSAEHRMDGFGSLIGNMKRFCISFSNIDASQLALFTASKRQRVV